MYTDSLVTNLHINSCFVFMCFMCFMHAMTDRVAQRDGRLVEEFAQFVNGQDA